MTSAVKDLQCGGPIKHCGKCKHAYTRAEWDALASLGRADYGGETLELKNCIQTNCGSTMAIDVTHEVP